MQFENILLDYFNANDIAATISIVKYSDEDVDIEIIRQTQIGGRFDLAYFRKSKVYEEQQERRIILGEHIDSLIKHGVGKRLGNGINIKVGNLLEMGYMQSLGTFIKLYYSELYIDVRDI